MDEKDWSFATGDLGDPLADIKDWMIPPFPQRLVERIKTYARGLEIIEE